MSKTRLFVGAHGGMSHAAAALNLKAVVIFGGFIDPKNLGDMSKQITYDKDDKEELWSTILCIEHYNYILIYINIIYI